MTPAERIAEMRSWIEGAGDDEQVQMNVEHFQWLLARVAELERGGNQLITDHEKDLNALHAVRVKLAIAVEALEAMRDWRSPMDVEAMARSALARIRDGKPLAKPLPPKAQVAVDYLLRCNDDDLARAIESMSADRREQLRTLARIRGEKA